MSKRIKRSLYKPLSIQLSDWRPSKFKLSTRRRLYELCDSAGRILPISSALKARSIVKIRAFLYQVFSIQASYKTHSITMLLWKGEIKVKVAVCLTLLGLLTILAQARARNGLFHSIVFYFSCNIQVIWSLYKHLFTLKTVTEIIQEG